MARLALTMHIRHATPTDIPAMMALEQRHYVGNLTPEQMAGGFISILHPHEWFVAAVESGGMHLATTGIGDLAGFIAVFGRIAGNFTRAQAGQKGETPDVA